MVVRLKFLGPGSPRKAAAIEPFSSALLGALNEITRCREIIWRHVKRTERRHDANLDLVGELLDIVDESPLDQQGDCMQDPGDRPFSAALSRYKHIQLEARRSVTLRGPPPPELESSWRSRRPSASGRRFEPVGRRPVSRRSRGWRRSPIPSREQPPYPRRRSR
jgi:hypothetical protein